MASEHLPSEDPLDLEAVDRAIRINEATHQLREMGMEESGVTDDCPPDIHAQFLEGIIAFESGPLSTQFEQLLSDGVELPAPDTLDDATLHAKLWEVINALAERDVFITRTDHLSDR